MTWPTENTPVISSKLECPNHDQMVERRKLLAKTVSANYRALLVLAPPGYGKTVFLSQLAHNSTKPVIWYTLDPHDDHLPTFNMHLAAAIQKHIPLDQQELILTTTDPNLQDSLRHLTSMFVRALEALAEHGALIILDNWQSISNPRIYSLISELISLLPPNIQMVIGGRNSLELPSTLGLHRLYASGELLLITRHDLEITEEELGDFFQARDPNLGPDMQRKLLRYCMGWPIALSFLTTEDVPPALANYLEYELLQQESPLIRDFLTKIAVLSRFSASDCQKLLGGDNWEALLAQLENGQLYLSVADDKYQLIPVIRCYLLTTLTENRTELFQKAGTMALAQGEFEEALTCYLEAGDKERALAVIMEAGADVLLSGKWRDIGERLEKTFTSAEMRSNPHLSLLLAIAEIGRGRLGHAQKAVSRAEAIFVDRQDDVGLAQCHLIMARIVRGWGAVDKSFDLLSHTEERLAPTRFKLLLHIEKSVALYTAGELKEAKKTLEQLLEEYEGCQDNWALTIILETLGDVCYLAGECSRALTLFQRALALCPDGLMPGYNCQDTMSAIFDDWGETEQALVIAQRALQIKEKIGLTESLPSSYIQMASVYTNLGRFADAELFYQKGIDYVRKHDSDRSYLALNLVFLARALSLQGKWIKARTYAEQALEVAQTQPRLIRTSVPAVAGLILANTGDWEKGISLLKQAEQEAAKMGFAKAQAYACQALAALYFKLGNRSEATHYTEKALKRSARINDLQNFVTCYKWYHPILLRGLELGWEVNFIQRVFLKVGAECLRELIPFTERASSETKQRVIPLLREMGGTEAAATLQRLQEDPDALIITLATEAAELSGITEPQLNLNLFGPVRIFAGQREITAVNWRSQRAKDLLIYLVHCEQPVSKEQIIEALWGEEYTDLKSASTNFHTTLYRLRQVLHQYGLGELIIHGTDTYMLQGSIQTDLDHFEALFKMALNQSIDSNEQLYFLEQALQHYHGPYLELLDYDWVIPKREALRLRHCEARVRLIKCYLATGQYERAIADLTLLLQEDELNEAYHGLLIRALAKSGQRASALQQYDLLVKILQDELGIKPSSEIVELYGDLKSGKLN
ncbi:MAG: tetratricopeptide repeat protein [Firmicutes bacterium]|nr:tetratricopeptide repeat protein [Bacillota bacterium]